MRKAASKTAFSFSFSTGLARNARIERRALRASMTFILNTSVFLLPLNCAINTNFIIHPNFFKRAAYKTVKKWRTARYQVSLRSLFSLCNIPACIQFLFFAYKAKSLSVASKNLTFGCPPAKSVIAFTVADVYISTCLSASSLIRYILTDAISSFAISGKHLDNGNLLAVECQMASCFSSYHTAADHNSLRPDKNLSR